MLVFWHYLSIDKFTVPSPIEILESLFYILKFPDTWLNILKTFVRVYVSLIITSFLGVILGSLVFFNKTTATIVNVFNQGIQFTASAVISIIAIVFFGLSPIVTYFVIVVAIFPNIFVATKVGIQETKKEYLELGKIYSNNNFKIFRHIIFPQLIPYILIGIIRSNAIAWKIAITAEVFIATSGLGFMINNYYKTLAISDLFAVVFLIIFIGIVLDYLIKKLRKKIYQNHETINFN
jgi:ABC-type nitrate/sulfonate/bicarbonate transport system permease component